MKMNEKKKLTKKTKQMKNIISSNVQNPVLQIRK